MNAVALVLLSLLAQAAPQVANPEAKARAQALLKEGAQHYQQGAFADALEKFEQAYAVFPSPKLLFNIGQASRELGRPVDAINAFEKFLAQAPDAAPELLTEARRSVEELAPKIGKLLIDCTLAGAEITVDGRQVGWAPLVDMIRLAPGNHQVTAIHPSATPAIQNVIVNAGSVETVVMRPQPISVAAPVSPAPAPAPASTSAPATAPPPAVDLQTAWPPAQAAADNGWWLGRKWTWVAAGSTVVFAGGATIAGLMMQSKFDDLRNSCGRLSTSTTGCSPSDVDAVTLRKNMANVFWGLTAVAAVATGALFYFEGRPVSVAPLAGEVNGMVAEVRY
jgi:hypothetical protein